MGVHREQGRWRAARSLTATRIADGPLLIVSNRTDYTSDYLVLELERRSVPFVRFNTEDYPTRSTIAWTDDGIATLMLAEHPVDLSTVPAVWYRRPVPPTLPPAYDQGRAQWAAGQAREALDGIWRTLDCRWVNHPDHNRVADCKPHQLRRAQELGFEVPASLVTNDPERAREFSTAHPAGVIVKPLHSGRITTDGEERIFFTSKLRDADREELDHVGPEPYLFQALIAKRYDVRATIIGSEVFAVRIESQVDPESQVDWRRGNTADLSHQVEELPEDLAERCVRLAESYGLLFAAVDLARDEDGRYVFFEINPNGQWAWIEQRTGLPLASRLTDALTGKVP